MEHIKKVDSEEFSKGGVTSFEYAFARAALNLAPIRIDGRYPEEGYTMNKDCDSVVYVLDGRGFFYDAKGSQVILEKGDQIHIPPQEAYAFEGGLDIVYAATPPWTPEQAKIVE